jgi:hypothetical protein
LRSSATRLKDRPFAEALADHLVTGLYPRLVGLFVLAGRTGRYIADAIALSLQQDGQGGRSPGLTADDMDKAV